MPPSDGIPVPLLNPSVVQSVPSCTNQFCFFLQGIVKALQEYQKSLLEHKVSIFVRRGGPNYQEGLRVMREIGDENHTRNCNCFGFSLCWNFSLAPVSMVITLQIRDKEVLALF